MEGFIKLHRQIMDNELYFMEKFNKKDAWIDLLLLANHKPATLFIRGIEINLNAGELCWSQLSLSKRWKWSDKTVKKYLEFLRSRNMIEFRGGRVTTVISIINWSKYQISTEQNQPIKSISNLTFFDYDSEQFTEQLPNNLRTDKNDKNVKNVKNNNGNNKKVTEVQKVGEKEIVIKDYFLDLLPITLNQQEIEAWIEWVDYRKEINKKLTKRSANKQVQFLLEQPNMVKCIGKSIQNQWQGLFEVKNGINKQNSSKGADGEFLRAVIERRAAKERA
jgi:hypothetical protein